MSHNCDNCNREIKRHMFCNGACKVAYHRAVTNGNNPVTKSNKTPASVTISNNPITNGNGEDTPEHTRQAHRTMNEELRCKLCNPVV